MKKLIPLLALAFLGCDGCDDDTVRVYVETECCECCCDDRGHGHHGGNCPEDCED